MKKFFKKFRLFRSILALRQQARFARWQWLLEVKLRNMFSRKIRVAFGPLKTGEHTLSIRKFHIDPIVNYINRNSDQFVCDVFCGGEIEDLDRFDIVMILKDYDRFDEKLIQKLKSKNVKIIYFVIDNPNACDKDYMKQKWILNAADAVLVSNPIQAEDVKPHQKNVETMLAANIMKSRKEKYEPNGEIKLFWEGPVENLGFMDRLNPVIRRIAAESGKKVVMNYYTNVDRESDDVIRYRRWTLEGWERSIIESDIAAIIKPLTSEIQQRKPPTKVQTYMASENLGF